MAHGHCMLDIEVYKRTLRICNNYLLFHGNNSKDIGLEVNVDKPKYMVLFRDQNAERRHNVKTENSSIESVEQFEYLGTNLTNQNSVQEEIKGRRKSGNACYHSVQNRLFSGLVSKNIKFKI
jgi:predicted transcriptional regulator